MKYLMNKLKQQQQQKMIHCTVHFQSLHYNIVKVWNWCKLKLQNIQPLCLHTFYKNGQQVQKWTMDRQSVSLPQIYWGTSSFQKILHMLQLLIDTVQRTTYDTVIRNIESQENSLHATAQICSELW